VEASLNQYRLGFCGDRFCLIRLTMWC